MPVTRPRRPNRRSRTVLSTGLMLLCVACQSPLGSRKLPLVPLPKSTANIESLRQPQHIERSVTLVGSVTQRLAILNGWLYQVDDGTGQVWISTPEPPPTLGQKVWIKGILRYQSVEIKGVDLGDYYLQEEQRQNEQETTTDPD